VSVAGAAEVVDDAAKKRELWSSGVEAWLPDGPDSPQAVLLRVRAASAEYWDAPGGRVATLLSFVKSKATGERLDGENERVDL
jgi:general stress protein 26